MLAFKAYLEIDNPDHINRSSIRYQFLSKLMEKGGIEKDFYVIEANQSGEIVEIRSYVIYLDSSHVVDVFDFSSGKWAKHTLNQEVDVTLSDNLKDYRSEFRAGFNRNDVVITFFHKSEMVSSEYYLYETLTNKNGIMKLFSLR
jgi:hypothetical protein